jgi:hypothetical protein
MPVVVYTSFCLSVLLLLLLPLGLKRNRGVRRRHARGRQPHSGGSVAVKAEKKPIVLCTGLYIHSKTVPHQHTAMIMRGKSASESLLRSWPQQAFFVL